MSASRTKTTATSTGSGCLNLQIREPENTSPNATIDVHILNTIIRNGYILFVDDSELLTKTSVSEFIAVEMVSKFCPNKGEN